MPRRSRSFEKHKVLPDPKFGSAKYAKFINYLMERGKKRVAQGIFYDSLEIALEKYNAKLGANDEKATEGRQLFDVALKTISPTVELKTRRVGGANYQVPTEVVEPRKTSMGMKWMITAARARKGAPMAEKLAYEILDAHAKTGGAFKKKEDTHRMAEANKAFAHFARFNKKK